MKKSIYAVLFAAVVTSAISCSPKKEITPASNYADVIIEAPDLSGITENGKEVLRLYKFAAIQVDSIYAAESFYPGDMTREEFDALEDDAKNSPYTLVRRGEDGTLAAVWFHDAYKERIDTIASCLNAAAHLTIKPSVKKYLLSKVDALRTDNYYQSEIDWLDMSDSKMDLVIGPDESVNDTLLGVKKSYEAYVLLKDLALTDELRKYTSELEDMQLSLPTKDEYKLFVPGKESNIFACNALYYGGSAADGVKVIGINLPFDERVQAEKGTRSILFKNVIDAKFNKIVAPVGNVIMTTEQNPHVDAKAFFWNIAFREVAHGLGVKETVNGRGSVEQALGSYAALIEEVKSDIVGVYLTGNLGQKHELNVLTTKSDAYITWLTSLVRSTRFGVEGKIGHANIICYNYLREKGAFSRNGNGKYGVNMEKMEQAVASLIDEVLTIQATGDTAAAEKLISAYSAVGKELEEDYMNLRLEKVPVDINFIYNF